jgi:hypothetical protein
MAARMATESRFGWEGELRPADLGEGAGAVQLPVADVPDVFLPPFVEAHVRDQGAPLRRDPRRPQIGRLDDVRVDVGDRVPLAESDPGHVLPIHTHELLEAGSKRVYVHLL